MPGVNINTRRKCAGCQGFFRGTADRKCYNLIDGEYSVHGTSERIPYLCALAIAEKKGIRSNSTWWLFASLLGLVAARQQVGQVSERTKENPYGVEMEGEGETHVLS